MCFPQILERASFLIRLSLPRFKHVALAPLGLDFEAIVRFIRAKVLLIANCSPFTSSRLKGSKFSHSIVEGPSHIAIPLIVLSHFQHLLRSLEATHPSGITAH